MEQVFAKLSLKELIRLRLICKRWKLLAEKVAYEKKTLMITLIRCDCKKEDAILHHCNLYPLYQNTTGKPENIRAKVNCKSRQRMLNCLSHVANLDVILTSSVELSSVLTAWSNTLTSLTLRQVYNNCNIEKLWSSLNSLNALRDLQLFHLANLELPNSMPVLSRLESFSLLGYYNDITPVLAALGPTCKRLSLDHVVCTSYQIFKLM